MGVINEEKILVEKIREIGKKLEDPPYSDENLLSLLEEMESLLYTVNQLTSTAVMTVLQPTMAVLISKGMLSHQNTNICVAVLSCICEIMRISAPNMSYNDDAMKLVFQRIVMSFERIDDLKSRSYKKIVSILESLAELRSCIIMLDLELDDIILEMFEHFLRRVSLQHPPSIFRSMEKIMTSIINESESDEIPQELVSCLLRSVKRKRMADLFVSFTLGENVIQKCADKLKPLIQAIVGNRFRKYSKVVASVCQETSDAMEQCNADASFKNQPEANNSERAVSDEIENSVKAGEHQERVGTACLDAELALVPKRRRSVTARKAVDHNKLVVRRTSGALTPHIHIENPNVGHRSGFKRKWGPEKIVGKRIRVWWPLDNVFYNGTIVKYYRSSKKHSVIYDDGDSERLHLKDEIWEFIQGEGEGSTAPNRKKLSRSKKVRRASEPKDVGSNSKLPLANSVLPIGWI